MPGPDQPDKTSDKSSTQSGKLDKSAGERLSQDAFPAPPKDTGSGEFPKSQTPTDKSAPVPTKGDEGSKLPQEGSGKDTKVPDASNSLPGKDQGFNDKPPAPQSDTAPVDKPPPKPPTGDSGGQFDKPPPPQQSADFGMPQKEPTDASKKVPVADTQGAQQGKPPVDQRSAQSDSAPRPGSETFNSGSKPPADHRSGQSDAAPRPASDGSQPGGKPPVDQSMAARNANQDIPEKLPQKQPAHDASRPNSAEHKPNATAPREERNVATPTGSEAPRNPDAGRAPRGGPDADPQAAQRAAERPRVEAATSRDPERRAEPQARTADTHPGQQPGARGAEGQAQPGSERSRPQAAGAEANQLQRGNLNPTDNTNANRQGAPADPAVARRGEAAVAESLSRSQNAGADARRDASESDGGRFRRSQGAGAQGSDEPRGDNARLATSRGSLEKNDSHPDARASAVGDASRNAGRDGLAARHSTDMPLRSALTPESTGRQLAGQRDQQGEHASVLRPEMKALADLVGKRSGEQDVSAQRGMRSEIQQGRLPQGADAQAIKNPASAGTTGDTRGIAASTSTTGDGRGNIASASAPDKAGAAAPRPTDAAPRVPDATAPGKVDATASGARPAENIAGARQPGRSPGDAGPAVQPGARPPADAATGARQPDRVSADAQGQGRQPGRVPSDAAPIRQPGTAVGDGKVAGVPTQSPGLDPRADGRTATPNDPAGRLPTTRVDGADRTPVKPGGILEPLKPGEKRELTGAEIAIAAIVAAAGAARVRPEDARIQRPPQPSEKDPLTAIQDALTPKDPGGVPIGFLPEFHVAGDAIALRGGDGGDAVEKGAVVGADAVQDQQAAVAAPAPVLLRPTCLVSENDTLVSIAEELFHDPNLGWLIADLNRDRIEERFEDGKRIVEVASRQELFVPVWQDIVEFYEKRSESATPENLVTIVSQSQLDRELLNSTLGKVVGTSAAPFASPAVSTVGDQAQPVQMPLKPAQDWKALAAGLPKATAAALLAFSNRWPKPPAAPASEDIVSNVST